MKSKIEIVREGRKVIATYKGNKGIAKCHPEDKFDFYIGIKLALGRLFNKPIIGQVYYIVGLDGLPVELIWENDETDNMLWNKGNFYLSKIEVIQAALNGLQKNEKLS